MNDIYAWSIVARLAANAHHRWANASCCLDYNVRQLWLPSHTNTLMPSEVPWAPSWRMDVYAIHHTTLMGALSLRLQQKRGIDRSKAVGAKNKTAVAQKYLAQPHVKTTDPLLLTDSINVSAWRQLPWDTEDMGVPLQQRLATCGCRSARHHPRGAPSKQELEWIRIASICGSGCRRATGIRNG